MFINILCLHALDFRSLLSSSIPECLGLALLGDHSVHIALFLGDDLLTKLPQELFVAHKDTVGISYTITDEFVRSLLKDVTYLFSSPGELEVSLTGSSRSAP